MQYTADRKYKYDINLHWNFTPKIWKKDILKTAINVHNASCSTRRTATNEMKIPWKNVPRKQQLPKACHETISPATLWRVQ